MRRAEGEVGEITFAMADLEQEDAAVFGDLQNPPGQRDKVLTVMLRVGAGARAAVATQMASEIFNPLLGNGHRDPVAEILFRHEPNDRRR